MWLQNLINDILIGHMLAGRDAIKAKAFLGCRLTKSEERAFGVGAWARWDDAARDSRLRLGVGS